MSSKRNLIILREGEFLKSDYDRFDIEKLSKLFQIFIINCEIYLNPYKVASLNSIERFTNEKINVKNIRKLREIEFCEILSSRIYVIDFLKSNLRSYLLKKNS